MGTWVHLSRETNNPLKSRMWLESRRLGTPDIEETKGLGGGEGKESQLGVP